MNALKKILWMLVVAALLMGASCVILRLSCSRKETERYAELNYQKGTIVLIVAGYHNMLLTPEGPFPKWGYGLKIVLNPDKKLGNEGKQKLIAGIDFSTQGDMVKSGNIVIDFDNQIVEAQLEYTKTYSWMQINGTIPIRSRQ